MFAVDLKTGQPNATYAVPDRLKNASTVLRNDTLDYSYLTKDKDNALYSTSVNTMDRFYTLGSIVSSPAISNGVIYFGSADGYLYALRLK
jgi:outer membrane protein assembly factor BamB